TPAHRRAICIFLARIAPQRMEERTLRENGPAYATRETQLTPPSAAAFMAMDDSGSSSALASALQNDENHNNFRQFFSAPGCLPPPTTMAATAVAAAAAAAAAAATTTATATSSSSSSSSTTSASPSGRAGPTLAPRTAGGEGEGSALAAEVMPSNDRAGGTGREGEGGLATGGNGAKFASGTSASLSASWSSSWASSISGRLGRVGARLISPGVSKRALQ
ncbi:unnamed protein product, partial [Laminaria digitata]